MSGTSDPVDRASFEQMRGMPRDLFNERLIERVHPPQWQNPRPRERYNLVVVGAGTAGLNCAAAAAALGGKVALIERNLLGGDCLNVGCVPSKILVRSARVLADMRNAEEFGVRMPAGIETDFGWTMERLRRLRSRLAQHDSAARFRELGVDVFFGDARFCGPDAVDVNGARLRFARAVIATGASAMLPDIPGLAETGVLTNETVFDLTERPKRLLVIGGGPLGCEIAQAFRRLGSEVSLIHRAAQFLPQEEREAAQLLDASFQKDGMQLHLNTEVQRIERGENGKTLHLLKEARQIEIHGDEIVIGAGRAPNVKNLGLEAAGVAYDERKGVQVDDRLRTSNPRIYAAGDVCLATQYTHMAEASARIVIQNALFAGRKKLSDLVVPWCTYTDPEIAHVGLYVRQAHMQKIAVRTYTVPMNDVDRAILDGEEVGFVKISVRAGTDKIIGATVVGRHAGEMINEITLAMVAGVGLKTIGEVIHSYPTQAESIRRAADAYNKSRLTPFWQRLSARWLAWRLGQ